LPLPALPDASIEEHLQPRLLETERPLALPYLGDLGFRVKRDLGPVDLGLSWVWVNEKVPRLELDRSLRSVFASVLARQPPDPASLQELGGKVFLGVPLVRGSYGRQHVFGLEATTLVGPTQLDVDVGYSPKQPFYLNDFALSERPVVHWVVGLSPAEDARFLYGLTYVGASVLGVPAGSSLFLFGGGSPARAHTAWLHALAATASYRFAALDLELGVSGGVELRSKSFAVSPVATYHLTPRWSVSLASETLHGSPDSPLGYFGRNDKVIARTRIDFF
jgi:hypothetical protein